MRLIQTSHPIGLREFFDSELPNIKYAILSHRWEGEEITFEEMIEQTDETRQKKGYQKVARFCERARADGFEYVWVDTCCINKESSAELSESINSMFRWYLESAKCYAYMSDMESPDQLPSSVWFTRGWTLQELIAPHEMIFLDKNWSDMGSREDLCHELEKITKIESSLLIGKSRLDQFSVAKRMSWAATRETTRTEDRAYCLMGMFNVNMPLLYGEGENAFIRLQEEILKNSDDETLFAWESDNVSRKNPCGLLAHSPKDFANSGDIFPVTVSQGATPFTSTNRGIQIQSVLLPPRDKIATLVLQCSAGSGLIGIGVMFAPGTAKSEEDFVRRKGSLTRDISFDLLLGSALDTVYIPKAFMGVAGDDTADSSDFSSDTSNEKHLEKLSHTPLNIRIQPREHHKKLVICFDDTKSGFLGSDSDSNVAKIHRMFERVENDQVCFYPHGLLTQPLKSSPCPDEISIFGYSKGGFAAQYLANLIDYIGILVSGHDHMIPEVWRIYHDLMSSTWSKNEQWEDAEKDKRKFGYMRAFRDAFVRPTGGIHFIGLFDAINIPLAKGLHTRKFMTLSSKIVRHALSVDEKQVLLQPLLARGFSRNSIDGDVQDVWFPGCHQDIGGEMKLTDGEMWELDHLPLVWMASEARKAGLRLDLQKQAQFQCSNIYLQIDRLNEDSNLASEDVPEHERKNSAAKRDFLHALHSASTKGLLHNELSLGNGWSSFHVYKKRFENYVASKKIGHTVKEHITKDNCRYIPPGAQIHSSVLRRIQADPAYRPSNVRISNSSNVVNKDDPVLEYFIQEADE
ncbi:hypothetical protein N7478_012949 [Penicillium angulare]|uniref:uncharacterized protein n=1 Tax=Penicillium angulare TaxID=116970 RepID=UPI0025403A1F|nr:uncharacterized protein N7478_012949 [Penicillium angulare]KAJ5256845.1 hypothetical protein N7478_012949 [Penicillium angulare]